MRRPSGTTSRATGDACVAPTRRNTARSRLARARGVRGARLVPVLLLPGPLAGRPAVRAAMPMVVAALGAVEARARLEAGHDVEHCALVGEALDRVHGAAIGRA